MPFLASIVAFSLPLLAAIVPNFGLSSSQPAQPPFPAPPGYLLPWIAGETHTVTQGEDTTLTHNGLAAYAFDFNLDYDIVVAARGGRVAMVRQDSTVGGCNAIFSGAGNFVVIDHGDGTSGLYLHLAPNAVLVTVGQIVAQGDALGVSGETGLTCSDDNSGPGRHLHFQVERTDPAHYFTQSLPIAFDDIASNDGVPTEGASYVSLNGRDGAALGTLTPHRQQRPFNPLAKPADPTLLEGDKDAPPPPPAGTATPDDAGASADPSMTPRPTRTGTSTPRPTRTPTNTPVPSGTPAPTDTPAPSSTPVPTDTPQPSPTDTPPPPPTNTPPPTSTPPPPTSTPPPTDTATSGGSPSDTPVADTATSTPTPAS